MMHEFTQDMVKMLRHVHVNMPWKYLPRYLDTVLRLRMNIELGLEAEELDHIPRSHFQRIADRLREEGCGVTLHGPFWDLCPGSVDPIVRQVARLRMQQLFDVVPIFRPTQVVCHSGYDPRHHGGHLQFWVEKSVALWEPLVERAELLNTPLLLENVWEHDPEFHRELLECIPSPCFGFCLDVGHQNSFSKTPLGAWLEVLSGFLKEIHLHDNDGTRDAHSPVGHGNIDFSFLFNYLNGSGKTPLLTLEPHHEKHLLESLTGLMQVMEPGWL